MTWWKWTVFQSFVSANSGKVRRVLASRVSRSKLSAGSVLVLLSSRDWEHSRWSKSNVAKQSRLLEHLRSSGLRVFTDFHVESVKFKFFSQFGTHTLVRMELLRFLAKNPRLFLKAFTGAAFRNRVSQTTLLAFMKRTWWALAQNFWDSFFARHSFDAVLGVMLTREELIAARKAGIPSFELQHGMLAENALLDYFPYAAPDFFCAWPMDSSHINLPHGTKLLSIPFSWSGKSNCSRSATRPLVLVILTHNSKNGADPWGFLETEVAQAISEIAPGGASIRFRFHPKTTRREIRKFKAWALGKFGQAHFETFRDSNISSSICKSHLVVLGQSSTWLDSLSLPRPSLIMDPFTYTSAKKQFPELVDVYLFRSTAQLPRNLEFMQPGDESVVESIPDFSALTTLLRRDTN